MQSINHYLVLIIFVLFSGFQGHGQHYVYKKTTGANRNLRNLTEWNKIIEGPAREKLSEWQYLPFDWTFYGKKVDGFYVSVNGYITFDKSARESYLNNTAIPDPAVPNNAIYACWGGWELIGPQTGYTPSVNIFTSGSAPNRTVAICWISLAPVNRTGEGRNSSSFFLFLHEQGDFEILMNGTSKTEPVNTTMGTENHDGTIATMAENSPDFDLPKLEGESKNGITYHFIYSDRNYQPEVISTSLPQCIEKDKPLSIEGTLWNMGSQTLHSFTANYRVNKGKIHKQEFSGLQLAPNDMFTVSFDKEWTPEKPGHFSKFRFWISDINTDKFKGEVFKKDVFVNLGTTAEKKVLIEEFTGTWCGWCPDGMLYIREIMKKTEGLIPIALHVKDSMEIPVVKKLSELYKPAYPQVMIDRRLWPKEPKVPVNRSNDFWHLLSKEALSLKSPVQIAIDSQYDIQTRLITATVTAEFVDYAIPGNYRLHFMIVENNVTGEGKGYDQANFYHGRSTFINHPYYDTPNPMVGYRHEYVLREVLSGIWGEQGIIDTSPEPGSKYSKKYSFSLPEKYNEKEIILVAFVSDSGPELEDNYIINTNEHKLMEQR